MKSPLFYRFPIPTITLLASACSMYGSSAGAPPGYTGAPTENTCVACHNGPNPGGGTFSIAFPDPNGYVPGQKYTIRVSLQDPTAKRWGFELTARQTASNIKAGSFAVPSGSTAVQVVPSGPLQFATQTLTGTYAQQITQAAWDIDWTAPSSGTGQVTLYAAGLASNNDNSPSGDLTYATSVPLAEQTGVTAPTIAAGSSVIPQFVFGGGWYTALYFTNQSSTQVSFNVNFWTDSATQMTVGGDVAKTILIPAGGTSIVEAMNVGSLSSGWATFSLPVGVSGYGVFRQSVAGRPDQEAVVPFASSTGSSALLTFDETIYTTSIAVWYDGSTSGTVTLAAVDQSGNSLGTTMLTMSPGTKQSFAVEAYIPQIAGHLGSLIVSVPSGSVSVLGLRFGGSAFTSIPPAAVLTH